MNSQKSDQFEMEYTSSRIPISLIKMPDGSKVETKVVSASAPGPGVYPVADLFLQLYLWTQCMVDDEHMLVGFDVEWCLAREQTGDQLNYRVPLLKLGSRYGCILLKLDFMSRSVDSSLRQFFLLKDITFVGLHIKEDLIKLKSDYGIVIRNAVDLSDLAGEVLGQPRLAAYSLKGLANEVLSIRLEHRSMEVLWVGNWGEDILTAKQIEVATIEAHFIFRIAEKLLVNSKKDC